MRAPVEIGATYGMWRVLRAAECRRAKSGATAAYWLCVCACGREREVRGSCLVNGLSKHCGCTNKPPRSKKSGRVPVSSTREYVSWQRMKARCYYSKTPGFEHYGGRGISVCDRWRDDFAAFLADMGPKPTPQHTIDRIDTDGDYEPSNCRWATPGEQGENRRNNVIIEFGGRRATTREWERRTGLPVSKRIAAGWPVPLALSAPSHKGFRKETA